MTGNFLVAAVTHLWFDPRHPEIKVAQANALCQAVVQFIRDKPWGGKGGDVGKEGEGEGGASRGPGGMGSEGMLSNDPAAGTAGGAAAAASDGDGVGSVGSDAVDVAAGGSAGVATVEEEGVAAARGTEAAAGAGTAAAAGADDVLQGVRGVPVVIAGDFNSLWRKYKEDIWDPVRGGFGPGVWKGVGLASRFAITYELPYILHAVAGTPTVLAFTRSVKYPWTGS